MGTSFIQELKVTVTGNLTDIVVIRQNAKDLELLVQKGILTFKQGSFTLHRDKDGTLRKVEKNLVESL